MRRSDAGPWDDADSHYRWASADNSRVSTRRRLQLALERDPRNPSTFDAKARGANKPEESGVEGCSFGARKHQGYISWA
jgi:hypothetical protein